MKPWLSAVPILVACSHAAPPQTAAAPAASAAPARDAVAAFETVRVVLQSPRCVNCHPVGDVPLQGDHGRPHQPLIKRGPEGTGVAGLSCAACHGKQNPPASYGAHQPPGVSTGWRLPPAAHPMVFAGLGSAALCEQLKDRERNGGKSMEALIAHVSADPLVLWGWSPGYGRQPVPIAHDEFVRAFRTWAAAGGPCAAPTARNP